MLRILVIADDLTGAAEMAGIAFSMGFSVKILMAGIKLKEHDVEVLVINSNTRNANKKEAIKTVGNIIRENKVSKNAWVFKKTDSLLRGNIESEIESILSLTPYNTCILIPANPSRKRTIRNGQYMVGNLPINQTIYRQDPEFPRMHSGVKDLIADASDKLVTGKRINEIRAGEILVPDISTINNIEMLIGDGIPKDVLTAGAADFFSELLKFKYKTKPKHIAESLFYPDNKCFIIGSYSQNNYKDIDSLDQAGYRIFKIPVNDSSSVEFKRWKHELLLYAEYHRKLAVVVPDEFLNDKRIQNDLVLNLGNIAKEITEVKKVPLHFLVTGGRTASCVCERIEWHELKIMDHIGKGVVTLFQPESAHMLTIKPGSYSWPDRLLK